ncbi:hypothetical protein [Geodermatophilus sp. TF02-6]|uniref:hypothetical protein n=1 Tax=Geodermatophilus sp. TF02-6 TaxID=2250575 RepID=UPI0018F5DEF1|nr:hypothetical protein [Geodermatophilus sp. TF02-6]
MAASLVSELPEFLTWRTCGREDAGRYGYGPWLSAVLTAWAAASADRTEADLVDRL